MGVSESDQAEVRQRLAGVQLDLRRLDATASSGAQMASGFVHGALTTVMNELDGAVTLLSPSDAVARVGCPCCGRMIMPAATRCGYCWRALSPATRG